MDGNVVFIALSGGVDSAVAAILLKEKGYKLHGVHMQNWDPIVNGEDESYLKNTCTNKEDLKDAKKVAELLNIPLTVYNFVPEYWDNVFNPFIKDMKKNLITNPDVLCNSKIKFGVLLEKLKEDFSPEIQLATGHYAKILKKNDQYYLLTAKNKKKDQTYFLSCLTQDQLKYIIFPLSNVSDKSKVREIAKNHNLFNWDRQETIGMCFIGKRNFQQFMDNYLKGKPGKILDIANNNVLGEHKGLHFYALHQKRDLQMSGNEEKYYVCKKDIKTNVLYLCRKSEIKNWLYSTQSILKNVHWINERPNKNDELFIKPKHAEEFIKIKIEKINKKSMKIIHESLFVTTPGQYIVFYNFDKTICLGSAIYVSC